MSRIAIIAAMPRELKPLVEGWKQEPQGGGISLWRKRVGDTEWIAACAGAGQDRAARAFAAAEKYGRIDKAISIGWAGALNEESRPGEAYLVGGVIDVRTGERFLSAEALDEERRAEGGVFPPLRLLTGAKVGNPETSRVPRKDLQIWLATAPRVADEQEKKRLSESYGAALVDMEAAAIARLARMREIPFSCIKGVSDGYTDHLPDFNRFIDKRGRFQMARFVAFTLLRPVSWPALVRMGENSKKAALRIAETVREVLGSEVP